MFKFISFSLTNINMITYIKFCGDTSAVSFVNCRLIVVCNSVRNCSQLLGQCSPPVAITEANFQMGLHPNSHMIGECMTLLTQTPTLDLSQAVSNTAS